MREYKFRGLDEANNIWRYGCLIMVKVGSGYSHAIEFFEHDCHISTYIVKPETVGQYTGMKDQAGKEIFEGDVISFKWVECDEQQKEKIIFIRGAFMVSRQEKNRERNIMLSVVANNCEILGNIHQNPELLEGKK